MEIKFQYADNYKNIFDLYLNNSVTAPTLLGSKSVDDSMAEFALVNLRWFRMETGHGAKFQVLTANVSSRKM